MKATNFDELVFPIAAEAPHAVILDWYRRLSLAITEYLKANSIGRHASASAERRLARDPFIGATAAAQIAELRRRRNQIAHESVQATPAEAVEFARKSLDLIGVIGIALDEQANS